MWGLLKPIFKPHEYWPSEACCCNSAYRLRYWNRSDCFLHDFLVRELQQCLPFTVLKRANLIVSIKETFCRLQQCLPFTVLKRIRLSPNFHDGSISMLQQCLLFTVLKHPLICICIRIFIIGCNSAYRLRYWNYSNSVAQDGIKNTSLQQHLPFTVLKQAILALVYL